MATMITRERLRTFLILVIAVASLWYSAGRDSIRFLTTPWVRVWNVYHYYIGSKYFTELGYFNIYEATLLADEESGDYWHTVWRVRNLKNYKLESRRQIRGRFDPSTVFTPQRWEDFQKDVQSLQVQMEPSDWRDVFRDRGYNPSPFWNAVGSFLSNHLSVQNPVQLKILCSFDLILFAATFAAIAWAFDIRTSAWVLILLVLSPVNEGRFVGGFLQYDWFCTFAIGFCFLKKGHPVTASVFIAYAILARIFPAVLLGCGVVALGWIWRRHKIIPARYVSFYSSLAIFVAAGVLAGSLGSGGNKAWPEFVAKISFHSSEHTYGERRVGLKQIFTREIFSIPEETSQDDRRRNYEANLIFYRASALAMLLLLFAGLKYTRTQDAILIGLAALFALTVSSRYYWSYLSLFPLLSTVTGSSKKRRLFAILCQCIIFSIVFVYDYTLNPDRYISYSILNVLLLFYLVALAAWPLASRLVRSRYGSLQISHSPRPSL